jgi:signal transduction histidine kinase
MNKKDKLYYDLINAYRNHSCNDTLIDTYIYKILKIVKDYLDFDNLKKENKELIVNKNVAQAVAFDQKREIGELKDQVAYLKEELEGSQSAYEWIQAKNSILKLENQELREQLQEKVI